LAADKWRFNFRKSLLFNVSEKPGGRALLKASQKKPHTEEKPLIGAGFGIVDNNEMG
jgi:hypothetical protein